MLAKATPAGLARLASKGQWKLPDHLALLNRALMDIVSGRIKRILVTLPPRHGKSMLISQYFPAWFLMNNPTEKIILASYEASFAAEWGRKAMDVINEYGNLWGVTIRQDMRSGRHFTIAKHGGEMHTSGVGGPITGKGGNIILDDPVKNAEEAQSVVYREKTWDWFNSTLYTRMAPDGWTIVIQTRWHEDDLAGRILERAEEDWMILNLPAIAEEGDSLGREPGKALWPERFSIDRLMEIKEQIGSYWWNALYQQRPSSPDGNLFKRTWWKKYTRPPEKFDQVIQSWDMSFKATQSGSFVVGQVWGLLGRKKYLLGQVRKRAEFTETLNMVRLLSKKYPEARTKLVEEKANGAAIISMLKKEISGFVPVNPKESKQARASAISPQVERGEVYLPEMESFTDDFIEEHAAFPNGATDDQVDACSQALAYLDKKNRYSMPDIVVEKKVRYLTWGTSKRKSMLD